MCPASGIITTSPKSGNCARIRLIAHGLDGAARAPTLRAVPPLRYKPLMRAASGVNAAFVMPPALMTGARSLVILSVMYTPELKS